MKLIDMSQIIPETTDGDITMTVGSPTRNYGNVN
jgi:hypothetical protein